MAESRQDYIKFGSIHLPELEKLQRKIEKDEGRIKKYTSYYDLKNEFLNPTQVSTSDSNWLWTYNNKYPEHNPETLGKWIIQVPRRDVDVAWCKTKKAIQKGQLWLAKVSTGQKRFYELMVYTLDYSNVEDVVAILECLETSGLKPPDAVIKYESDDLSRAGFHSQNPQNQEMYSSDTIRLEKRERLREESYNILKNLFWYNLDTKEVIMNCMMKPSDVLQKKLKAPLWAINTKYKDSDCDLDKAGHWTIRIPPENANRLWYLVRKGIVDGDLWQSKLSYGNLSGWCYIRIFTKDYRNKADVIQTLEYIERSGLMAESIFTNLVYTTDEESSTGSKTTGTEAMLKYESNNIRWTYRKKIFRCTLNPKEVIQRSDIKPTEIIDHSTALWAINDKYTSNHLCGTGYWEFDKPEETIDATWEQIKDATEQGILWKSKIVKKCRRKSNPIVQKKLFQLQVYSPDCDDRSDVIEILEFIERSGIKPAGVIHYYFEPALCGNVSKI